MIKIARKTEHIVFDIKEKGRDAMDGIWTFLDGSMFSVLEIKPIPFFDLSPANQNKIKEMLNESLWQNLDFPIEILVRPVNVEFDKKLSIMDSLLGYAAEKEGKLKEAQYYQSFMQWFKNYTSKNVKPVNKYYIVINYNSPYDNYKELKSQAALIIGKRITYMTQALKKAGLEAKRLSTQEIEKIYDSFVKFYIFSQDSYLFPEDWINLFKKSKGKIEQSALKKEKTGQKVEQAVQQLKKEIHEKGILYFSYIQENYKQFSKPEFNEVISRLETDTSIVREEDVFSLLTLKSSTEQELYKDILNLEHVEMHPDHIKIGNTLYRGFIVVANPENVHSGFFHPLFQTHNNLSAALHIEPESPIKLVHHLRSDLAVIQNKINTFALQGKIVGREVEQLRDKEKFLQDKIEKLANGILKTFRLNLTFMAEDTNSEDLDFSTNRIVALLKKMGFISKMAINYQHDILKTILPSGANFLRRREIVVTNNTVSDMFPFVK